MTVGSWTWLIYAIRLLRRQKYTKGKKGTQFKFFLVVINTFDRVVYTRALKTKEPSEVRIKLSQIIEEAPKKPKVISSDNGAEMLGVVSEYLEGRGCTSGISYRVRPSHLSAMPEGEEARDEEQGAATQKLHVQL